MSEPVLSVRDLHVSYGRVRAVRGVSFDAPEAGLIALVGANGAGKTSVLNAVSGLIRPRSGTVLYRGRDSRDGRRTNWSRLALCSFRRADKSSAP